MGLPALSTPPNENALGFSFSSLAIPPRKKLNPLSLFVLASLASSNFNFNFILAEH